MAKKSFSTRKITNALIVVFGVVVLAIISIIGYQLWRFQADTISLQYRSHDISINYPRPTFNSTEIVPSYIVRQGIADINNVKRDFLEVYDPTTLAYIRSENNATLAPTNVFRYYRGEVSTESSKFAVLPLTNYDYSLDASLNGSSATHLLLASAQSAMPENTVIRDAVNAYTLALTSQPAIGSYRIIATPSVNSVVANPQTVLPVKITANADADLSAINHISVFVTKAGKTYSPPDSDAGRADICKLVKPNPPSAPLARLLGITSGCDASGNCGAVNYDKPVEVGTHQIFAVAMKSNSSTACAAASVLGWSVLSDNHIVNIYSGNVAHGANLTISYPSQVIAGKPFTMRVETTSPPERLIDHISLFVAKTGSYSWSEINDETICKEANAEDQGASCLLCLRGRTACPSGACDNLISVTLNQTGQHRIVGVGVSNTDKCAAGAGGNLVTINKEGVITVVSANDPTGEGGGSDGGSDTNGDSDQSNGNIAGNVNYPDWVRARFADAYNNANENRAIKTLKTLMSRIGGFTLLILGILAIIGIIMAGLKYITAGGDQQKAESGKKALLFSVYGIILAVLCVFLIQTTVNEIRRIAAPIPGATNTTEITMPFKNVGPVAELADFFNQDGLIWAVIILAIVYSEAVAIFFILYASFQYMTAYGDESKAEGAKKTIIWAVVGLAVVLSTNVILNIFTGFVL